MVKTKFVENPESEASLMEGEVTPKEKPKEPEGLVITVEQKKRVRCPLCLDSHIGCKCDF